MFVLVGGYLDDQHDGVELPVTLETRGDAQDHFAVANLKGQVALVEGADVQAAALAEAAGEGAQDLIQEAGVAPATVTAVAGLVGWIAGGHVVPGRLLRTELPNGVVSEYDYNDAGWLEGLSHTQGEELMSSFLYVYDDVGNRTAVTETM